MNVFCVAKQVPESQVASMGLAVLQEQSRNATDRAPVDKLLDVSEFCDVLFFFSLVISGRLPQVLTDCKARFVGDSQDFRRAFLLNYLQFLDAPTLFNKIQERFLPSFFLRTCVKLVFLDTTLQQII